MKYGKPLLCLSVLLCILYTFSTKIAIVKAAGFPEVTVPSACLLDAETGRALYEKDADEKRSPASITKIMTALLTIELAKGDYSGMVYFSEAAVNGIDWDSSRVGMKVGDSLSVNDALYGLMLPSGNDAAVALAEYYAGSVEAFAKMMTERARELGAVNTHFTNPHGLYDENHYTTARDMAIIMRQAVQYPKFVEIISAKQYTLTTGPEPMTKYNTNKLILDGQFYDADVIGGKTGFTGEAKHTLVTYGKRGGVTAIVCVMGAEKNCDYEDTALLLNACFDGYAYKTLLSAGETVGELAVIGNFQGRPVEYGTTGLIARRGVRCLLPMDLDLSALSYETELYDFKDGHIEAGAEAGLVTVGLNGEALDRVPLFALSTVNEHSFYAAVLPGLADGPSAGPGEYYADAAGPAPALDSYNEPAVPAAAFARTAGTPVISVLVPWACGISAASVLGIMVTLSLSERARRAR